MWPHCAQQPDNTSCTSPTGSILEALNYGPPYSLHMWWFQRCPLQRGSTVFYKAFLLVYMGEILAWTKLISA